MNKIRGFEVVSSYKDKNINLPKRQTKNSAGYDFEVAEDTIIPSFPRILVKNAMLSLKDGYAPIEHSFKEYKPTLVNTGVKAYMQEDEVLRIYPRSSIFKNFGLILTNGSGIIDQDYYDNPDNEGVIMFSYINLFPFDVKLKKRERVGQGIFSKFLKADSDNTISERIGGIGSTNK